MRDSPVDHHQFAARFKALADETVGALDRYMGLYGGGKARPGGNPELEQRLVEVRGGLGGRARARALVVFFLGGVGCGAAA